MGGYNIDSADITFKYDVNQLNGISEDNLTIFCVDEENKQLVPLSKDKVVMIKYAEESEGLANSVSYFKYGGVGVSVIVYGYTVCDDSQHSHSAGRIFIDTAGVCAGVTAAFFLAPLELPVLTAFVASCLGGFIIGMTTSAVKRYRYGD